ncbi:hypothetical protein [Paludisphaera soli]|uniref:hypothetical protein n=1 Tax=Paludisphaera soli TaxID=2712865 RepID=UPI0013ED4F24|nr:hypothetical protein [Paludisphaera soli]
MKRLLQLLLFLGVGLILLSFVSVTRVEVSRPDGGIDRAVRALTTRFARDAGEPRSIRTVASDHEGTVRQVLGQVSATEERAKADARRQLVEEVRSWLDPQVPMSWLPPGHLVDDLVVETRVTPEEKPYGTVYTAALDAEFDAARRDRLIAAYQGDVVHERILKLGALFGFLLVCLASTSGYIRADEATKGYYTSRLRLAAAAVVGASGVLIYQMLS